MPSTNTVTAEIPPAPIIVSGSNSAPGQITLTWNNNGCSDITSYDIYQDGVSIYNNFSNTTIDITGFTLPNPSYSYSFYIIAKISLGGNDFISPDSTTETVSLPLIYYQTGFYYANIANGYTGYVALNSVIPVAISFNYDISINVLVVAGGGGGGCAKNSNNLPGGGGGGGGIYYNDSFNAQPIQYNLVVGVGGSGVIPPSAPDNNGQPGTSSTVTSSSVTITSTGGGGSDGANGASGGGSSDSSGNVYPLNGGYGASGNPLEPSIYFNGENSIIPILLVPSINLPFTFPDTVLYLSGGGGSGENTTGYASAEGYGGGAGNGVGGLGGAQNPSGNGENAYTSFFVSGNSYFGGGGGGCPYTINQGYSSGNGANGVIIFWWLNP